MLNIKVSSYSFPHNNECSYNPSLLSWTEFLHIHLTHLFSPFVLFFLFSSNPPAGDSISLPGLSPFLFLSRSHAAGDKNSGDALISETESTWPSPQIRLLLLHLYPEIKIYELIESFFKKSDDNHMQVSSSYKSFHYVHKSARSQLMIANQGSSYLSAKSPIYSSTLCPYDTTHA